MNTCSASPIDNRNVLRAVRVDVFKVKNQHYAILHHQVIEVEANVVENEATCLCVCEGEPRVVFCRPSDAPIFWEDKKPTDSSVGFFFISILHIVQLHYFEHLLLIPYNCLLILFFRLVLMTIPRICLQF